jgi:DHA3 family macrolide efflux protein-like MFS transporter
MAPFLGFSRTPRPIKVVGERITVLRDPNYRWFISGYAVSRLGDGIQYLATAWLALSLGAGWTSLIWTFTATTLPALLVGLVAGVAVDRADRRRLAIALDITQGIVVATIVACFWAGVLQPWLFYLLVFTLAALNQVYIPTIRALVHQVVKGDRLLDANATTAAASQIGMLLGAIIGGWLIAAYSAAHAMCLNAVSFIFSATMIALVPRLPPRPPQWARAGGVADAAMRYMRELSAGFSVLWRHPRAKPLFLGLLTVNATVAFVNITLPIYVRLNMLDGFAFGLIDSGFAVGAFLGAALIPMAVRRAGATPIMAGGVALLCVAIVVFPWLPTLPLSIVGYAAIGFAVQIWLVFMTRMQLALNADVQARVQAIYGACAGLLALVTYQLVGLGIARLSISAIYLVFATVLTGLAVSAILRSRTMEAGRV